MCMGKGCCLVDFDIDDEQKPVFLGIIPQLSESVDPLVGPLSFLEGNLLVVEMHMSLFCKSGAGD